MTIRFAPIPLLLLAFAAGGCTGGGGGNSASLVSIAITPGNPQIGIGLSLALAANGTYDDSSTRPLAIGVTWSSSDTAVATVDAGMVTSVALGSASIMAQVGDITGSTTATIINGGAAAATIKSDNVDQTWIDYSTGSYTYYARIMDTAGSLIVFCGSTTNATGKFSIPAGDVLLAGHTYHAEAFADTNANGIQDDLPAYYSPTSPGITGEYTFTVPYEDGNVAAWGGPACP